MLLIGCIICTPISRPIKGTETNALLKNNEQPRVILASFDLQANLFMKRRDSTSTKLNILGVKQQVFGVKKLEFYIFFKNYLLKSLKSFEQMYKQQLTAARSAWYWAVFSKDRYNSFAEENSDINIKEVGNQPKTGRQVQYQSCSSNKYLPT